MISFLIKKLFGSSNERYIKRKVKLVQAINNLEPTMQALDDADFPQKIAEYRQRVLAEETTLDALLPEVFALVREASVRVLGMRHFDVQLIGGIVLHSGRIAEMKTGEGKTLMATLAVVLNAIPGKGVHVVTVNDYLASRDAEWMGKLYNFLGLTVGTIVHGITDETRKAAYEADITYGTNNEFGFDYLRDNMKFSKEQLVQRGHNYAIVDEVDSILIDEARTPLIISGASEDSTELYATIDSVVLKLKVNEHYTIDEKAKTAMLTDSGIQECERLLGIDNLFDMQNILLQHHVQQSLKAHTVFKRDVDYIVSDGAVVIVDEFTGRPMPGRRFSDGLHQALEARERVKIEAENQTLASITFQNYFRLYTKLSGMTGTADTEAVEFREIYGLEVVSIPTHRPMVRNDMPDVVYRSRREKFEAIVQAIIDLHKKGQPVLVGTISIETSEYLSSCLTKAKVPHNVLNAKHHAEEANIIAEAGQKGRVTIATNMAGRGTDIVLGEGVRELGGLFILGTERHESRRIDNQLRGRSGRQGDAGCSQFYLSLEDDLMRIFGSERLTKIMETLGLKDGESIQHKMISRAIENAQKRVEGHNFDIRKTLLDYDNVMNQQREVIYSLRHEAINEDDISQTIEEFLDDTLAAAYEGYNARGGDIDEEEAGIVRAHLQEVFNIESDWQEERLPTPTEAKESVLRILAGLKSQGPEIYNDILRYFLLESLDKSWKDHLLNMDRLRDGIGLRGYGQRDPKQEYKRDGFNMFQEMLYLIRENVFKVLTRVRLRLAEEPVAVEGQREQAQSGQEGTDHGGLGQGQSPEGEQPPLASTGASAGSQAKNPFQHKDRTSNLSYSSGGDQGSMTPTTVKRDSPKVGRNDPCPCGSGKKYKHCCGR